MMIGVIAYFVSLCDLPHKQVGIKFCIFTHDKKRRADGVFRKQIKNFSGFPRVRTVIKRYGNSLSAARRTRINNVSGGDGTNAGKGCHHKGKCGAHNPFCKRFHSSASVPTAENSSSSVPKRYPSPSRDVSRLSRMSAFVFEVGCKRITAPL